MSLRKKSAPPLGTEAIGLVAARFRLLGDPTRLRLLQLLQDGERTVGELARALHTTQANTSKHLKLLVEAGLVSRRPEGNTVHCAVADPLVFELCDLVCTRMARLHEQRAATLRAT